MSGDFKEILLLVYMSIAVLIHLYREEQIAYKISDIEKSNLEEKEKQDKIRNLKKQYKRSYIYYLLIMSIGAFLLFYIVYYPHLLRPLLVVLSSK